MKNAFLSRNLFLILVISIFQTGCGRLAEKFSRLDEDTTKVNFATRAYRGNGFHTQLVLNFGVMIYAENAQDKFRRLSRYIPQSDSPADMILPNGTYNFYVVGYDTAGMAGNMYCGRADNVLLNGAARDVQLVMNNTGICAQAPFAPDINQTSGANILDLYLAACHMSNGDLNLVTPPSNNCDAAGGRPSSGAGASTAALKLLEYNALDGRPNPVVTLGSITSTCLGAAITGTPVTLSRRVPLGTPFAIKVITYAGAGCTGVEYRYTFGRGLLDNDLSTMEFQNGASIPFFPATFSSVHKINAGVGNAVYLRDFF